MSTHLFIQILAFKFGRFYRVQNMFNIQSNINFDSSFPIFISRLHYMKCAKFELDLKMKVNLQMH